MQFVTHEDIDAPIDYVYGRVSNFAAYERQALRNGAHVARLDGSGPVCVGSKWDAAFTFRGKDRRMQVVVEALNAPTEIGIATDATGLSGQTTVNLVALSPHTTRVTVKIALKAQSLSARLLLQSLKLAKNNLNTRFRKRVRRQVQGVASDYKQSR